MTDGVRGGRDSASDAFFAKYRDPRWQHKRLEILQRAQFKCEACGESESPLHVHHGHYRRGADPWDYSNDTLWCLCEGCHEFEGARLNDLKFELGRLHPSMYDALMGRILELRAIHSARAASASGVPEKPEHTDTDPNRSTSGAAEDPK